MAKAATGVRSHLLKVLDSQSIDCSPDNLRAVDRVCVEFETAWPTETPLTIETLLENNPQLNPDLLLQHLLPVELELNSNAGVSCSLEALRQRFPEHPAVISAVFQDHVSDQQAGNRTIAPGGDTRFSPNTQSPTPNIPGYRITGKLGQGGMGIVYRAVQQRLNREVALKVISGGLESGARRQSQFLQEGEIVASLNHPGIAHVYDAGEADGVPYLASELVDGGTLADIERPLPHDQAVELVKAITNAMAVAHQHGIVHRDLKPSNILLADTDSGIRIGDRTVQPKITDFGLAYRDENDGEFDGVCGTPDYMAPEQTTPGQEQLSQAMDIHAIGVVLYELLTGVNPYRSETVAGTIANVRTLEAPAPSSLIGTVPSNLDEICRTCLRKSPEHRFDSTEALLESLNQRETNVAGLLSGFPILVCVSLCVVTFGIAAGVFLRPEQPASVAGVRQLAQRFLRHGGKVQLVGSDELITQASALPDESLEISVLRSGQRSFINETDLTTIGRQSSLRVLNLSYQFFPETGQHNLGNLTDLKSLDLFNCRLDEHQLEQFLPRLTQLETLVVGQTNLPLGALRHAANCRQLKHLVLSQNMVGSPEAAALIRQFPKLKRITFYGVHDSGLVNLAKSETPVEHVVIFWGQKLSNTGMQAIARLPNLRKLSIRTSNLLDADLLLLAGAPRLQSVSLRDNQPESLDIQSLNRDLPEIDVQALVLDQAK